jgi:hypothetical protein
MHARRVGSPEEREQLNKWAAAIERREAEIAEVRADMVMALDFIDNRVGGVWKPEHESPYESVKAWAARLAPGGKP